MMNEQNATPSLEGYDALVILGSKCAVYDHEVEAAWFHRELALIGEADARQLPILGICFGAQALCRHFGASCAGPSTTRSAGLTSTSTRASNCRRGPWFEFHFDACELPESPKLWATSQRAVQAFAIGPHVGVQFHPEVDDAQLKEWLASTKKRPAIWVLTSKRCSKNGTANPRRSSSRSRARRSLSATSRVTRERPAVTRPHSTCASSAPRRRGQSVAPRMVASPSCATRCLANWSAWRSTRRRAASIAATPSTCSKRAPNA